MLKLGPASILSRIQCSLVALVLTVLMGSCGSDRERVKTTIRAGGGMQEDVEQVLNEADEWVNHGNYSAWYESGRRRLTGSYDAGKKTGLWTTWYDIDPPQKLSEGEFVSGEMHGQWSYWMSHTHHLDHTAIDSQAEIGSDGQVDDSASHDSASADSSGGSSMEHSKLPHKRESFDQGVPHGLWISWRPDRSIADSAFYVNGKLEGRVLSYHPNGQLASESSYKNGKRIEPLRIWNEAGKLLKETE